MERTDLIAQIWGGELSVDAEMAGSPLAGLLGSLMDVPVITLASEAEMPRPIAAMDETEIVPGGSLGDVLAEELAIEVPYGALVLIQPKGFGKGQDLTGQKLGEILGQIILDMSQGAHTHGGGETGAADNLAQLAMSGQLVSKVKLTGMNASRLQ